MIEARLAAAQLSFIAEIDRLKTVYRASPLAAAARRQNDAEHSWHLAMMVILLAEYADGPLDRPMQCSSCCFMTWSRSMPGIVRSSIHHLPHGVS
jgi:5'-deoxynucleotidase YfbR-like HD superfamily hydrolase